MKHPGLKKGQNEWWEEQARGYHGEFSSKLKDLDKRFKELEE